MVKSPFEGIKVAEFAWVVVGPLTSRYLADHGATVVRIESHTRPDPTRFVSPFADNQPGLDRSMFYGRYNANKLNVSLDLDNPKGRELAWKLIMWADVVTESFTPKAMKKWGLDYETVKKVRPDLVYFSTCQQGQYGPHSQTPGYGHLAAGLAGFPEVCGWPDQSPSPPYGAWGDFICARFASTSIIAALEYKRRTGKGQWIDQSQFETTLHFLSPLVMDYIVNRRTAIRQGNRLSYAAPHGVYPCRGSDRWVAITVFKDEEWQALARIISDWASDPRFATLSGRKENEDHLEALLSKWTGLREAQEIEGSLQAAGVPAQVVEKCSDLFADPQLKSRGYFVPLRHPEMGVRAYENAACYRLSKTPRNISRPSPCLGEHNEYVYKTLLGLTDDQISDYMAEGAITAPSAEDFRVSV